MAHILEFRSNAVRVESECEATLQGSAQIIIFPGVRIERHGEPPAEPQVEHWPSRAGASADVPSATGSSFRIEPARLTGPRVPARNRSAVLSLSKHGWRC